jgi:serine O-acetyltransferase
MTDQADVFISPTTPDWSRERPSRWFDPSRRFLAMHRKLDRYGTRKGLGQKLTLLRYRFWSVIGQIDIQAGTQIGGGLLMPHPNGIVIHPRCVIGPNCLIMQQVTLGVHGSKPGAPRLGGHVDVSAGAKIIGPVTIGDHALIGANAVVTKDVPEGAIMAGIPARQIGSRLPQEAAHVL